MAAASEGGNTAGGELTARHEEGFHGQNDANRGGTIERGLFAGKISSSGGGSNLSRRGL